MNLQLSLKKKWFEMTDAGIKPEDYRGLTPHWYSILCLYDGNKKNKKFWEFASINSLEFDRNKVSFKDYDFNIMTLGYPKSTDTDRIRKYKHEGIEIRTGNPKWGAEPNKLCFVIKHGPQITQ